MASYPVQELCRRHSFEEVAYLRWHGELPTREQLSAQHRVERAGRAMGPRISAMLAEQSATADPLDCVRAALSILDESEPDRPDSAATPHARTLRLFAVLPTVVAACQRLRRGLGPIAPRDHLGYVANLLSMTFGKVPEPQIVAAFETALILYTEHSPYALARLSRPARSADSARSARSDVRGDVDSAISALRRSETAEAGRAVVALVNEISIPDNAAAWVEDALADLGQVPGFSDRANAPADARVPSMRWALGVIASLRSGQHVLEVYESLVEAVHDACTRTPTLDVPASLACQLVGFDPESFASIVAIAQLPGWTPRFELGPTPISRVSRAAMAR
jgi:citrate synthase